MAHLGMGMKFRRTFDFFDGFRKTPSYAFHHYSNVANIGDRFAGPYHHFDFKDAIVRKKGARIRRAETIIIGGGLMHNWLNKQLDECLEKSQNVVAWGIGGFAGRKLRGLNRLKKRVSLCSTREYTETGPIDYVPCVSCMSPFLSNPNSPSHKVVLYAHDRRSDGLVTPEGIPTRSNHGGSFQDALDFIASGETVVSNSYHGVYWALLMGRKVLCLPFNNKFQGYKMPPGYAGYDDWPQKLGLAQAYDDYLADSRAINQAFYQKVMNLG